MAVTHGADPAVRTLAGLATAILTGPPLLGRTRLVLVDGPSGSGKSTLAGRLERALGVDPSRPAVTLVHLDDLYEGWSGLHADRGSGSVTQRLLGQLMQPLADGRTGSWQRYDWVAAAFAEWHDVEPPDVLLLEGCGAIDPEFDERASSTIWVEVPRDLRMSRGIDRDGEIMRAHWRAWQDEEDALFARRGSRARADLRVNGDPWVAHDPEREMVLLP